MKESTSSNRVGHGLLAVAEFIPVIGAIVALVEKVIAVVAKHFQAKKSSSTEDNHEFPKIVMKAFVPNEELDIKKGYFSDVAKIVQQAKDNALIRDNDAPVFKEIVGKKPTEVHGDVEKVVQEHPTKTPQFYEALAQLINVSKFSITDVIATGALDNSVEDIQEIGKHLEYLELDLKGTANPLNNSLNAKEAKDTFPKLKTLLVHCHLEKGVFSPPFTIKPSYFSDTLSHVVVAETIEGGDLLNDMKKCYIVKAVAVGFRTQFGWKANLFCQELYTNDKFFQGRQISLIDGDNDD